MSAARVFSWIASLGLMASAPLSGQVPAPSAPEAAPSAQEAVSSAQKAAPSTSAESTHAASLTAEDLSAYLDGLLPAAMAAGDIAGATVAVVQDDRVLLSKAYGFSNMEKRTPVAVSTIFRPGSISKLVTWTAVMQLVEAGKVELDADVNQYIDFRVTGFEGKPITLRHLLTHTPGFEEGLKDLLIQDPEAMLSLETVIKANQPTAIFPPGAVPAYSNYGAALAGYIVQHVSGMPFEQYVEEKIFAPLRMTSSTFRQPVPSTMLPQLSEGYVEASGKVITFEYCPGSPAGALSSSAPDMASFMLAHLNGGALPEIGEASRILKPETVEMMHATANTPAKGIDAMALGFYEQNRNGVRAIAHGGDLIAFHSELILIPEARVGLFVSFNSTGRNRAAYTLRSALAEGFMDRYFPRDGELPPAPKASDASRERASQVAGHLYELSRRAETNLFSLLYMTGQSGAQVTERGTLMLEALLGPNDKPRELEEVTPWNWREVRGQMRLAAVLNEDGSIRWLVPDGYGPIFVFQPVPGWRSKAWLQLVIIVSAVVVTTGSLAWLVGVVRRRVGRWRSARRQKTAAAVDSAASANTLASTSAASSAGAAAPAGVAGSAAGAATAVRGPRWLFASRLSMLAALVFVLLLGAMLIMFSGNSLWVLTSAAVPFLRFVQLAALLTTIGAVASVAAAFWSWSGGPGSRWRSVGRTLVALACVSLAYVAIAFHFLTPTLRY